MFRRLQDLGPERFGQILNQLMRGETATGLARTIQQLPPNGWGLFHDVGERTLTQQLNRLRLAAAEGAFGPRTAKKIGQGGTPQIKMLERVSVKVLDRLEELSEAQRTRVFALIEKEKLLPTGALGAVNEVAKEYRLTLLDIQKARFDLGLDEFKGPLPSMALRGATQTTTLPDGTNIQKQVFEAVSTIEQIFEARRIPQVTREQP